MFLLRATLAGIVLCVVSATTLLAQDVILTSRDGSVEISGALVGYDGEFYRVETVYGVLTVDGSGVLCAGPGCPDLRAFVAHVRFSGSDTMGTRLLPALIEAFARNQDYEVDRIVVDDAQFDFVLSEKSSGRNVARFAFLVSNSDEGFADLLAEEADIVMSDREVYPEEVLRAEEAGLGRLDALNQGRVIALDALVPVVSHLNPVQLISPTNLYKAFAGEITNWNELGGIDAPIVLHLGAQNLGLTRSFYQYMGRDQAGLASNIRRHENMSDLVDMVAKDPFALGVSAYSETGNSKRLVLAGSCGFLAFAGSETLRTEDYPLTAPQFLYLPARRLPAIAREFLRYSRSAEAMIAVNRVGFVGQTLSEISIARQGNRLSNAIQSAGSEITLQELQRMISTLDGARRLTLSFRFTDGSSDLDAQSRSNIVLIARALEAGDFDEREIFFVGFSDGEGPADANRSLSRKRAQSVRSAVLQEATTADPSRLKIRVEAFGEAMPMACDDSEWGRQVNRRVEVWLR